MTSDRVFDAARRVVRESGFFAGYLALAAVLTWPLALKLNTAVADFGDPLLNAFILDWVCHSLTTDPFQLFNAPIFHPAKYPLAFSEHMTGIALLVLPFHLAGLGAVAIHNLAILISFALSGYGAFTLCRLLVGNIPASLIGGVFFAFAPFRFEHLAHVQVLASGWMPLTLAALIAFWRSGSRRDALFFSAALVMNGLSNIYWMLFVGFAVAVTIIFLHVVSPRPERHFRRRLAFALVGAIVVLLPFLIPYVVVSDIYKMQRSSLESSKASATVRDWFVASPASAIYGSVGGAGEQERRLFPGVIPIALALSALALTPRQATTTPGRDAQATGRRRLLLRLISAALALIGCGLALAGRVTIGTVTFAGGDVPFMIATLLLIASLPVRDIVSRSRFKPEMWVGAIWIVIGVLGSFGENAFLHSFLFRVVEPFRATRVPARWALIAYAGLAPWIAVGAMEAHRRLRFGTAWLLLAASVAESIPRITWNHVPPRFPSIYSWLASERPSAVVELPIGWNEVEAGYVLAATHHRVPIFNGVSGFDPPLHSMLSKHRYNTAMLRLLDAHGASVVIVHQGAEERAREWITSGQLQLIATFPEGDAAYRIDRSRIR